MLLLCTTENREASSAESLIPDSMFSDKSCTLEKRVDQEQILVAHLLFQATILKSDHWVRIFEMCLLKSSEQALVTNLKLPLNLDYI